MNNLILLPFKIFEPDILAILYICNNNSSQGLHGSLTYVLSHMALIPDPFSLWSHILANQTMKSLRALSRSLLAICDILAGLLV